MAQAENWNRDEAWISLLLRLFVGVLFGVASINKFIGGLENVGMYFETMFKETWLPPALVQGFAGVIAYVEALLAVWILSGLFLRWAWVACGLMMISLAFGTMVAGQHAVAANNTIYLLTMLAGLYVARYDPFHPELTKR